MMFLLDVNALLAMHYECHEHFARVHRWSSQLARGRAHDCVMFATCPITELGFVRVSSGNARYTESVDTARDDLRALKSSESMVFIPDDLHVRDLPAWVRKSAQTTDGYLLALAKSHGAELATLDRFIPDALLIPQETQGPIMIRDQAAHPEWVHVHRNPDQSGSVGIATR